MEKLKDMNWGEAADWMKEVSEHYGFNGNFVEMNGGVFYELCLAKEHLEDIAGCPWSDKEESIEDQLAKLGVKESMWYDDHWYINRNLSSFQMDQLTEDFEIFYKGGKVYIYNIGWCQGELDLLKEILEEDEE